MRNTMKSIGLDHLQVIETSSVVQSRGVSFSVGRANLIKQTEQCSALGNSTTHLARKYRNTVSLWTEIPLIPVVSSSGQPLTISVSRPLIRRKAINWTDGCGRISQRLLRLPFRNGRDGKKRSHDPCISLLSSF